MITDTRAKILLYISEHSQVRAHDLSAIFHLSNVAIHKQLRKLVEEGKVAKMGKPPVVFYMQTKGVTDLQEIKRKVTPILKKAHIKKAAIFGSYARGDNTRDSDIDILVAFPSNTTLLDFVHLKRILTEELNKEVDIVSYNGISPLLRESILSSQYPIL